MRKRIFFVLLLHLYFGWDSSAAEPSPTWYLISETEVARLETLWTNSLADRQNWLSQVQTLRAGSQDLNQKLSRERETTANLQKLFSEYEADQYRRARRAAENILALTTQAAEDKAKIKRLAGQRNALAWADALVALVTLYAVIRKIAKGFGIRVPP